MHWLRNIGALAASGRRLWIPDLPGFGDSAAPPVGHDADAIVAPLGDGMQRLLGSEPVDLVGFSFGGLVAGLLAAQMPMRVRRLVIVGAPGLGVGSGKRMPLSAWRHLATEEERMAAHRSNLATLMLLHRASIDELAVAIQAANAVRDRMGRRRMALTDTLLRALRTITCPVHAIYGDQDAIYRDRMQEVAAVLKALPGVESVALLPDAGHWVQYERPHAFNAELGRILQ